mmetsp:Transcript_36257/g.54123  ORF Transcript_36257/g.54123 Transcript_36257/m.54123 type:complete len:102 (+) Transcript_36257:584-889(+)|eukprot:CAMPEP_0194058658 /NCGR_PEP_ID=MMETSP0009_2-20130614/66921_1 /TAXON_ID=210454 /ORGANISM="Grammatophora oceanica, Strain CCMP 410" /LENGTH=101 /DNA_ID=CAMNT_0038708923 /DNA_START=577 /DNA_END=882 /DNA_ORIENTATION=+
MVDLTSKDDSLVPEADLYVLSDVFENSAVAEGSARLVHYLVQEERKHVWVFAQSDRSQREVFLRKLQELTSDHLQWSSVEERNHADRLQLVNVEEGQVSYG